MSALNDFTLGQLRHLHSGKVREIYRAGPEKLLILATDRLSAFDQVLQTPIPGKGAVLNSLTNFWFEQCADIVPNHLLEQVDPSVSLVREAQPIRIEVIVRGYLCGSMWRRYAKGERRFSGREVPDGLTCNCRLPQPLVNPTTKEASDREITPAAIAAEGWAPAETYREMERIALRLFARGSQLLAERGIILVDTKYEFGLIDGQLVLIDEIHTPDSSRFWPAESWERDPVRAEQLDKEFVRAWLLRHKQGKSYPSSLPAEVIAETSKRYREIFERITGGPAPAATDDPAARLYRNLVARDVIKPGYVAILMGSPIDAEHSKKIKAFVESYDIAAHMRVVSAHKNAEEITAMAGFYNHSLEPGAVVAVAGLSNGLGGAVAANFNLPVINAPPFKDKLDLLININSSLMLPSKTPAGTVVRPESAAMLALRSLNLRSLRQRFNGEIAELKAGLREQDAKLREM